MMDDDKWLNAVQEPIIAPSTDEDNFDAIFNVTGEICNNIVHDMPIPDDEDKDPTDNTKDKPMYHRCSWIKALSGRQAFTYRMNKPWN